MATRKFFDLPDKLYGKKFEWINKKHIDTEQVVRRIKSVGLLPKTGTGQGWLGIGMGREISFVISKLLKEKILTEVQVKGSKKIYVMVSSDIKLLEKAKKYKVYPSIVFLAPLDNLLWDRKMIYDIFDFKYKWETYTPKDERKYGHYTLPILFKDKLVGRIEPRQNGKILEIWGLWLKQGIEWDKTMDNSFFSYFEEF